MTHEELGEKVAAQGLSQRLNPATLAQMNERLGSIDARLTSMAARMATKGELRTWGAVISGLLALATAIMLKYG